MHYYHTLTTQFGCTIITVLPEDIYSSGDGFTFPLQMEYLADITINRAFDNRVGSKCSRAEMAGLGWVRTYHAQSTGSWWWWWW
ncbi:hypothetical protein HanPSC8_Chr16g0735031 [Helianthus annuus]|nr:hypothetical protein HanHA89_Chr16g0676171 [Helianthus annuus]KAJ0822688.1 hypothetical protein HanPSC8_Chr16g0735031 [Helianthus annuus]